jgi:Xaa-Pro aminopeptidase
MHHAARIDRLRASLDQPLLVTDLTNVRYLTGFAGSNAFVYVDADAATFVTDGRYGEIAGRIVAGLPNTDLVVYTDGSFDHLARVFGGADAVGLEANNVTWAFMRTLRDKTASRLLPTKGIVEKLRETKDDDELAALQAAATAGDAAFSALPGLIAEATTESDLGHRLVDVMEEAGGSRAGWEPIVAVNANAALPHHRAGTGELGDGVLLLDYGCTVDGYHSDMTRTVAVGDVPDPEFERVYAAVLEANRAGIDAVRPGAVAGDVDEVCRSVLREHGYEEAFIHSTGHGVGLDIHEAPSLRRSSTAVLAPGHVVTIEPGVYLPGRFGVRIEDMVAVTTSGAAVLTASHRDPSVVTTQADHPRGEATQP